MIYTVYKTTNLLDGKYYIGVHLTDDPNDIYRGSGKRIGRALKKYGLENFRKEILFESDDKELAYFIEAHLVTDREVSDPECYNLKKGGSGGGTLGNKGFKGRKHTTSTRNVLREKNVGRVRSIEVRRKLSRKKSPEEREKISSSLTGKPKSDSHKEKISVSSKKFWSDDAVRKTRSDQTKGSNNSQFGSFWITNGSLNKKCRQEIPDGWRRGRVLAP